MIRYILLLSVFLSIACFNASSQTVEPDWGPTRDLEKGTYFQKIAGFDKDGYLLVRSNSILKVTNDKIYIEYYSSVTNDMESIGEIILPSVNGVQSEYEDLFYLGSKIILFTSVPQGSLRVLYVQYLNNDGTLKNKPREIGSIPIANMPNDKFRFKTISDSQILVTYNNSFMQYNGEPFNYKIINSNLIDDFSETIEIPLKERSFEIVQQEVTKTHSIILLAKAEIVSKKKTASTQYEFILFVYNSKNKEFNQIPISVDKYIPLNMMFTFNKEENVVLGGLFANKTRKVENEFLGCFYQVINPRTLKVISNDPKKNIKVFDKNFITSFAAKRNGLTPDQYYNLLMKEIVIFENNGIAFIAEQYYTASKTMIDPGSKSETTIKYYYYNDLLVFGVNKEGVLDWYKSIPKNQESLDDFGYWHSIVSIRNVNQVKILYNDLSSNLKNTVPDKTKVLKNNPNTFTVKGQAVMISIFADGSFEKYPLFPEKDSKVCILPKVILPMSKRILAGCQEGKTVKFCTFAFE
ncbi:MAG: hypothetical protein CVU05_07130 [Bacteroidetes bacterium HGW-Bacteroidetes-21]|jgi:hypothetical protein|nr:MAG: hypothetical protein CVU05_07130 [Bacteroidetes bacterium HGW-Bacteroidetes-21]